MKYEFTCDKCGGPDARLVACEGMYCEDCEIEICYGWQADITGESDE